MLVMKRHEAIPLSSQFQTLIDRQRTGPQLDDRGHVRLLEVPLPERQENGVILAPSTATIRIQE
jgi:hypothetical protein